MRPDVTETCHSFSSHPDTHHASISRMGMVRALQVHAFIIAGTVDSQQVGSQVVSVSICYNDLTQ